jgi:hypothetical protein
MNQNQNKEFILALTYVPILPESDQIVEIIWSVLNP